MGATSKGITHSSIIWSSISPIAGSVVILLFAGQCLRFQEAAGSSQSLALPSAKYNSVVWLPDGQLLFFAGYRNKLDFAEPGDPSLRSTLGPDDRCRVTDYVYPQLLPDGRIGLIKYCSNYYGASQDGAARLMLALDWQSQAVEQIVSQPLADAVLASKYTWNPQITRGIQELTNRLQSTLYWISPASIEPMTITVSDKRRSWALNQFYPRPDLDSKGEAGIAEYPSWSPDGQTIAFWASLDAMGRADAQRDSGEFRLFVMNPQELQPRDILGDVYHPHSLHWSPNSRWLTFTGEVGVRKRGGLYMFSPVSRRLTPIASGEFGGFAWSPDSRQIAAVRCMTTTCDETGGVLFDISKLID